MFINGYPYTNFRAVNSKDGRFRLQDGAYGVRFEIDSATLTDDRKIYAPNASGTMVVRGYHLTYGTCTFTRDPNQAAHTLYTGTAAITGLLSTSILIFSSLYGMNSSATNAGPLVMGGRYLSAGVANLCLYNTNATTTIAAGTCDYILLHPQTS